MDHKIQIKTTRDRGFLCAFAAALTMILAVPSAAQCDLGAIFPGALYARATSLTSVALGDWTGMATSTWPSRTLAATT